MSKVDPKGQQMDPEITMFLGGFWKNGYIGFGLCNWVSSGTEMSDQKVSKLKARCSPAKIHSCFFYKELWFVSTLSPKTNKIACWRIQTLNIP